MHMDRTRVFLSRQFWNLGQLKLQLGWAVVKLILAVVNQG